jgi:hypothetical protein
MVNWKGILNQDGKMRKFEMKEALIAAKQI